MTTSIRNKINRFPRVATYQTGWAGRLTFADLYADLTPNMNRLLRYYRKPEGYLPDILQEGYMRLWDDLSQNPDMLAHANKGDALRMVLDRTRVPGFVNRSIRREVYLDDLATRSGDPDEFIIEGYEGRYYTDRSEFSRAIDIRLDLTQVMKIMADKYQDSPTHLAALYYITTDVNRDDAAKLAGRGGTKRDWWLTSVVKPMREELAELLGMFVPTKLGWKTKFSSGDEGPFWQVVDKFRGRQAHNMVEILRGMAEQESCKSMAKRLNLPQSKVFWYRRHAHEALRKAYRCAA